MSNKTMREIRLQDLTEMAGLNYGKADLAIMRLQDDFEDGTIPACKARKEYAKLRTIWVIDGQRYARLKAALLGREKEAFYDVVKLSDYDTYFGL